MVERVDTTTDLQPCGHPRSAIVSSGEGTNYCGDCAENIVAENMRLRGLLRDYGFKWQASNGFCCNCCGAIAPTPSNSEYQDCDKTEHKPGCRIAAALEEGNT